MNNDLKQILAKVREARCEWELKKLMDELEEFNKQNYKAAAIDIALETGNSKAFIKLVVCDTND
ncbi:hypothetical protein ACQKNX_07045 [Lysinibacillus sp. NPDC093712]|uniref:hypothetical protein n=1 Tax=Lysinibacillus sp. NPDC093712 TaxID=3390579 RepID=UPI003CFFA437